MVVMVLETLCLCVEKDVRNSKHKLYEVLKLQV